MLTLRQRIFIAIGIIAGLVLAIVLYVYFLRGRGAPETESGVPMTTQETAPAAASAQGGAQPAFRPPELTAEEREELFVKQTARIFVERFGSYSNQNNNRHIDDVLSLSTPNMQKWLETQRLAQSDEYSGVTTALVASRVESRDETNAVVIVDVQQSVSDSQGERVQQKSGRVELEKVGELWLVSAFYWSEG